MDVRSLKMMSRRDFLKATVSGLAGLCAASRVPYSAAAEAQHMSQGHQAAFGIEPHPIIKVLRWSEFVHNEKEIWLANTRRWENLTGGRVIADFMPWRDVRPKAAMAATIGTGPDIVFGFHDDPHLYPDKLVDVTVLADHLSEKYGGWYPVCETYGRNISTNRWIALPLGLTGMCINYRKSRVREAGFETVPREIEGLLKCCQALRAKGYYTGFALGHAVGDANGWSHWWLWSFGGKTVEDDGKTVAINSRETIQALEAARQLYETMIPGVDQWLDPDNNKAFLAGDIVLTPNGSSIAYAAKHNAPDIYADLVVTNMPFGPVGRPTELSSLTLGYIFQHTPVPNAAKHFLGFMFEAEQYESWLGNSFGYITQALKQYYHLPFWENDPRITPYRECASRMLPNGYSGPLGTRSAATMSEYIVVDMFADVCTRGRSPRQAALAAERRLARFYR